MLAHIKTHLGVFVLVVAWDWTGVAATRFYAHQSIAALGFSAVLTMFWLIGIKVCQDRRVWPTALLGAVLGTLGGLYLP